MSDFATPEGVLAERVTEVKHYTNWLFHFRMSRPQNFRFRSGEFVMIALPSATPIWRAYSMTSATWDEELEFYSIKVPNGPLTKHLQKIEIGDVIWMRPKATGTLVLDALLPAKRLWLLATGTGFAPFASLLRDPETYDKFDEVIITHTCRFCAELAYAEANIKSVYSDALVGEAASRKLNYLATTTQEASKVRGRITTLIEDGELFKHLKTSPLNPDEDRVMICGSMAFLNDMRSLLKAQNFTEGSNANPGQFLVERAFVD